MHVLFAIDTWALIGGTERHAAVAVPALVERGHRVTVLCREARGDGMADVPVLEEPALEGAGLAAAERDALAARVRAEAPDVIFLSALRNVDALETLLAVAPVVRYVHDHTPFCPGLNKYFETGETCTQPMGAICLQRYWLRGGCTSYKKSMHRRPLVDPIRELRSKMRELSSNRRSARVLTNSAYMRRELLKVGFAPDATEVLYYFTGSNTAEQPQGELPEATRAFVDAPGAPLLFTPARLTLPDKGVDYLLTVLAKLKAPFRAVVAGSGPAEEWLRGKAANDGIADRVHFTGWLDKGGMETLYARAHAVVCPSVWDEPFGLVGIEAMAHGKPVVAFRVGGIPEWLDDGETGFLVERKDTDAMAAAVQRLLTEEGLAARLGSRGREVVGERFGRDRHMDGLEAALYAVTASPASSA